MLYPVQFQPGYLFTQASKGEHHKRIHAYIMSNLCDNYVNNQDNFIN